MLRIFHGKVGDCPLIPISFHHHPSRTFYSPPLHISLSSSTLFRKTKAKRVIINSYILLIHVYDRQPGSRLLVGRASPSLNRAQLSLSIIPFFGLVVTRARPNTLYWPGLVLRPRFFNTEDYILDLQAGLGLDLSLRTVGLSNRPKTKRAGLGQLSPAQTGHEHA